MFESHFGLRENPFASGHQPRFVYPSREHQEALAHLRYGIENLEPFVLITGEVGTGKTTALFEALGELQARVSVALITNSALTRGELIEEICLRFGVGLAQPITKPQAMAQLERHLLALRGRGERAILLIDEAQNFDRELLEEIRLLSNLEAAGEKLLQIFLVGQPELEARLDRARAAAAAPAHRRALPPAPARPRGDRALHPPPRRRGRRRRRAAVPAGDLPRGARRHQRHPARDQPDLRPGHDRRVRRRARPRCSPAHVRAAASETSFQSVLPAAETDPRLPPPLPAWPAAVAPRTPLAPVAQPAPAAAPVAAPEPVIAPAPPPAPVAEVAPEVVARPSRPHPSRRRSPWLPRRPRRSSRPRSTSAPARRPTRRPRAGRRGSPRS